MVICAVVGCHHRSGRDNALVKFYRVPSVRQNGTPDMKALSANRRALWLLRICREDMDDARATKNGARVCSRHFVSGSPSILEDITNPDWAPSLHLGHDFFDGKRKLRKRKKECSQKCNCESYVAPSKYRRNYKKSLKKEKIIDDDYDDDTSYANRGCCVMHDNTSYANRGCCVMHDNFDNDSHVERSMSSPEISMSDASETSNEDDDSPLVKVTPEDSTNNKCIAHINVISANPCSILSKQVQTTVIKLEVPSSHISAEEFDSRTQVATESDEVLLRTAKSEDNFLDDDNSENIQEDNLHEIHNECSQKTFSKSISEPKSFTESGQISYITHSEAFSATETLLRYIMNQDEVNDADVNFTLNLARKIKEKVN